MAKRAKQEPSSGRQEINLSLDPEVREKQMIALAESVAAQRMLDGTVSSQVLCHYLKLGTIKYELELETAKHNNALLKAKTKSIESASSDGQLYLDAINAMRLYSGQSSRDDDDEED